MVESTIAKLKKISRNFNASKDQATAFAVDAQKSLDEKEIEAEIVAQLPEERRWGKKDDETPESPIDKYRSTCFNVMNAAVSSISSRFAKHKQLYLDMACFDPRIFSDLSESTSVPACLARVTSLLCQQDIFPFSSEEPEEEQQKQLKDQLLDFACRREALKKSLPDKYNVDVVVEEPTEENTDETEEEEEKEVKLNATLVETASGVHSMCFISLTCLQIHFMTVLCI